MKRIALIFLIGLACFEVWADEPVEIAPAADLQAVQDFLNENFDASALSTLGVDADRVQQFLAQLEKQFQGDYVLDLSASAETARQILPVLKQFEETQPYAAWLESRLDYFSVSEKLRQEATRTAKDKTRLAEPSPTVERKVWIEEVKSRAMPPLAFKQVANLKKIFVSEKVPPELVWLAEVESSFDPKARSPAGAAGLFQLMPPTAREQDLKVGLLRDERFNSEKNARAAAQYLRKLHQRFGDWRLALAAYNSGETRVADLLKKSKTKSFDAISRKLPAETRLYVPKVEATVRQREGRALSDLKTPKGIV